MRKIIISYFITTLLLTACDGLPYKVTVEYAPEEAGHYEYRECYECCEDVEPYNPNLIDPYSEDTNWYIDEKGSIVWRKRN